MPEPTVSHNAWARLEPEVESLRLLHSQILTRTEKSPR